MMKDYTAWTKRKAYLHNHGIRPTGCNVGDVWWVCLGSNIGFEEDGKNVGYYRPVIVIRVFSKELFLAVPLTSIPHRGTYYMRCTINKRDSYAMLHQIRTLDLVRLQRKLGKLSDLQFESLKRRLNKTLLS